MKTYKKLSEMKPGTIFKNSKGTLLIMNKKLSENTYNISFFEHFHFGSWKTSEHERLYEIIKEV
jgi:hypothetical protein